MESETPISENPDVVALTALRQRIRRPAVSLPYVFGMGLVALAMLVLPMVYLAVVASAGYAIYWHVTQGFWFLSPTGGIRIRILLLAVYLGVLAVGLTVLFFLLKPLLARRRRHAQPLALHPGAEPRLYAFIEAVSHAVGAPAPRRIDLSCDLNASAGFRCGFLSFLGNDLVLTLGLPLVANLTVGELAGVVAHEFGHFNQGIAMRLHHVVFRVNRWFARVVYGRDAWDDALQAAGDHPEDWRTALLVWTAQLGVGLSRMLLSILMHAGIALSAYLSRQMEFHADRCEVEVAGSEASERTTLKFATLALAMDQSGKVIRDGWTRFHRLPDNLPELIRQTHVRLTPEAIAGINSTLGLQTTAWHDTHPCPAERIRRARRAHAPGLLADDRPASSLFQRFDIPARQVTELHYTDDLGIPIGPESLAPLNPVAAGPEVAGRSPGVRTHRELVAAPLADSLLLGAPELLLPLPLPHHLFGGDPDSLEREPVDPRELELLVNELESARAQIVEWADRARRIRPLPAGAAAPTAPDAEPFEPSEDAAALRQSAWEVIEGTARRLGLGLRLALREEPSEESASLLECHSWLYEAYREFDGWWTLYRRTAGIAARSHPVSALPEAYGSTEDPIHSHLTELRLLRSTLLTRPRAATSASSMATSRRLRVGPQAAALREIDDLAREALAWFETYHACLATLWDIAGREEARIRSDSGMTANR